MRKKFLCTLAVLTAMLCFAGCQQNSDVGQAEQTSAENSQTTIIAETSENQTGETAEASEETFSQTETEIAEEMIEEEEEGEAFEEEEEKIYPIDPEIVFSNECYKDDSYINKPMFIGSPEGSEANVYVMLADESDKWEYYEEAFGETFSSREYVLIEYDGTVDIMPCKWVERFGDPFTVYAGDFDGDGETELASVRYSIGGTFCIIDELSVFKRIDGHYQCFTLDNNKVFGLISYEINDESKTVEFTIKNSDASFVLDISSMENFNEIAYGDVIWYYVEGDRITLEIAIFAVEFMPYDSVRLTMTVNFSDGEFTCSEPVFEISED